MKSQEGIYGWAIRQVDMRMREGQNCHVAVEWASAGNSMISGTRDCG